MHLKNCIALFLLAVIACQAAPSSKIDKKSVTSETATKIGLEDLKLEDAGTDKDRTKKSATTFCVEVHSGATHQVPCKEKQPENIHIVQPIPVEVSQPVIVQPSAPAPQIHVIQPPQAPPQPIQPAQPAKIFQIPAPQQPPQIANIVLPPSQPIQPAQPAQIFQLPPPQQPPQSANIVLPAPQAPPAVNFIQSPPAQQAPVVNIVPAPAAPCNPVPTYNIVQPQPAPQPVHMVHYVPQAPQPAPITVIQEEPKPAPIKIEEVKPKPAPKPVPKPQPLPEPFELNIMPVPKPCYPEPTVVVPSTPLVVIPEPEIVRPAAVFQMPTISHECRPHTPHRPTVFADCSCRPQSIGYRKDSPSSHFFAPNWPRTHSKLQQHHVMVYPAAATMPNGSPMSVQCSPNVLSLNGNASPIVLGATQEARDMSEQGRSTMVSIQQHGTGYLPSSYYPSTYPNPHQITLPGTLPSVSYGSYPTYPAYSTGAYIPQNPSVTVNAYPHVAGPFYRESQPWNKDLEAENESHNPIASEVADLSKELNNQKREADISHLEGNDQKESEKQQSIQNEGTIKEELKTDETEKKN